MKTDVYEKETPVRPRSENKNFTSQKENDREEMMKKVQAAGTPGAGHRALEQLIGNWKCDVKCWMDPNGKPEESHGTAKNQWVMGGRYLQEDFQGQMMGRPFTGRSFLGFNNVKQAYESVWFDDMSTSMFISQGKGDAKTITLEGKASCPGTGQTDLAMKAVYRITGPDTHTFEMFDGSQGGSKTMEITYTRQ